MVQTERKEVNSCEARIRFAFHHLSYKDVHFAAKRCGEFTTIFVAITVHHWLFIDLLL